MKERTCGCGHEEAHHLADARNPKARRGPCNYGHGIGTTVRPCGCQSFHSRGARGIYEEPSSEEETLGPVGVSELLGTTNQVIRALQSFAQALERYGAPLGVGGNPRTMPAILTTSAPKETAARIARAPRPRIASSKVTLNGQAVTIHENPGEGPLPKGQRDVLTAIAQHHEGISREHLTILTGFKRSYRDLCIQQVKAMGLIEEGGFGLVATPAGRAKLGPDYRPLPTGDALRELVLERLPNGEALILELLASARPNAVTRDELSTSTGFKKSYRDLCIQRLKAQRLVRKTQNGAIFAAEELFG